MLFSDFYELRDAPLECGECGWTGTGRKTAVIETRDGYFDFACPRCSHELGTAREPSLLDADAAWDHLTDRERIAVRSRELKLLLYELDKLGEEDELPEVETDAIVVDWDYEEDPDGRRRWYVLRVGDLVLWREPAFFEDYKRFPEVVELLMERYGTRLKDVVPTGEASFFLWGDSLAAGEVIKDTRARVYAAANPPPPKSAAEREREHQEFEERRARAVAERELRERRERAELRSPDQLPDVEAAAFEITWDWERLPDRDDWYVLSVGDRELWRMPAFWEDYKTFGTVGEILVQKYGPRLKDVVPTRAAESNMWGDRLGAPSWIEATRTRIRSGLQHLHIDVDHVVADFDAVGARLKAETAREYAGRPEQVPGVWRWAPARPDAIEAVLRLSASYEVQLASRFDWRDERASSARSAWLEQRLGEHTSTTYVVPWGPQRGGDYAVDDRSPEEPEQADGELILLGSEAFPDWDAVVAYLEGRRWEHLRPAGGAGPA